MGSRTPFPYANLDRDDVDSFGPEYVWITSPYRGTYTYAVFDWTDQFNDALGIAGTNATVSAYNGTNPSPFVRQNTVASAGSGDWWYLFDLSLAAGFSLTVRDIVQVASPGPYDIGPSVVGGGGQPASGAKPAAATPAPARTATPSPTPTPSLRATASVSPTGIPAACARDCVTPTPTTTPTALPAMPRTGPGR